MDIVVIDFETYYDKDYSLTKLTTEAYIRDPRFETIMVGIRWPDGSKEVYTGTHAEIEFQLSATDWSQYAVLAHNTLFDGAILAWKFNVRPRLWLDTLSMARAMFGMRGNSLALLAKRYGLDDKGSYVVNMMGRRRNDMSPGEFKQYSDYCLHDVELCYNLWLLLSQGWYNIENVDMRGDYPVEELRLIDQHIRMFTEPKLRLNKDKLLAYQATVAAQKAELLSSTEFSRERLASNPQFAEVLRGLGVEPPTKISKTTGKRAFAFAKTDPQLKALLEHPDARVQTAVAARLGVKSTLEETRIATFIGIAERDAKLPIPLKYSYARTKRSSGGEGINMQNLPARSGTMLKACIEPPPGCVLIDCDSSNIEARVLAWLAEQEDLVEDFRNGVDVYCKMGTRIYEREITKADVSERFISKTVVLGCLAEGTLVLCKRGWVPIENVTTEDKVWDGLSWVQHQGLLPKGSKETLNLCGLWLTPDHQVLCGTEWKDAQSVLQDESTLFRTLVTGQANLPSQVMWQVSTEAYHRSSSSATAGIRSTPSTIITSKASRVLGVISARLEKLLRPAGGLAGFTRTQWPMTSIGNGYSIAFQQLSLGAITRLVRSTSPTAVEVSTSVRNGETIGGSFLGTFKRSLAGITQILKWTGQTITKATSLGMSASLLAGLTSKTVERSQKCRQESTNLRRRMQTYDLALAGPRNRFTVWTERGPVIVHNCGYGTGALKLQATLKVAQNPVDLSEDECQRIVDTYRTTYPKIRELWRKADRAIEAMHGNKTCWLGREGVLSIEGRNGVKLPSGLYVSYPNLHRQSKDGKEGWIYIDDTGPVHLYGAKMIENMCQALARIIVMSQLLRIKRRYPVVLTVHDSNVAMVKESERAEAQDYIEACMRWTPAWAAGLPINCESKWGYNYGELKGAK